MIKVLPFGDRIMVHRRPVGDRLGKSGLIIATENTAQASTDLADVIAIPESSFADKEILSNAERIVQSLTIKATEGDSDALIALLRLNTFLKMKSIRVGDACMISKYVGTDFNTNDSKENLTLCREEDIIGLLVEVK